MVPRCFLQGLSHHSFLNEHPVVAYDVVPFLSFFRYGSTAAVYLGEHFPRLDTCKEQQLLIVAFVLKSFFFFNIFPSTVLYDAFTHIRLLINIY